MMNDEIARSADALREKVDIERKAERESMWLSQAEQRIVKAHAPDLCDICRGTLRTGESFYDGHTRCTVGHGRWAWMCSVCFEENGVGLGTGRGQQFSSKTNEKEAG